MTGRRGFLRGMALVGVAGVAGCLGGGGDGDGGSDGAATPTTVGSGEDLPERRPGPDGSKREGSLASAIRVVEAVGTNVDERRIRTVALIVEKADWVEAVDLSGVTVEWATPTDSYELVAASASTAADGYFGVEPVSGTGGDATLKTADERHRLVFDLGTDDAESDDRHREREPDTTHFGSVLREDDVVSLQFTTAEGATTTVRLLAPGDVMRIEDGVELTVR